MASVMVVNYVVSDARIDEVSNDAYLINTSGLQRMLSQRIALLTLQVQSAETEQAATPLTKQLAKAVDRMDDYHRTLSGFWAQHAAEGRAPYTDYLASGSVDDQVVGYLATARRFIEEFEAGGIDAIRSGEASDRVITIATGGLLDTLDRVVHSLEDDNTTSLFEYRGLEKALLAFGLLVILLEYLLSFRPTVAKVISAQDALKRANEHLTAFSYRITHDIKAPVSSARGLVSLLDESIQADDKADSLEVVALVRRAMANLDTFIEELVSIIRTESTQEEPDLVAIAELVDDVVSKLSYMDGFERVVLRTDLELDQPVGAQPILLRQIVQNLVSNAVKYGDPTKAETTITILARSNARNEITIEVRDDGAGIPERQRDDLFGMFKRFHPALAAGSGLGLYLVARSASEMEGSIDYTPLSDGSSFALTFPNRADEVVPRAPLDLPRAA